MAFVVARGNGTEVTFENGKFVASCRRCPATRPFSSAEEAERVAKGHSVSAARGGGCLPDYGYHR